MTMFNYNNNNKKYYLVGKFFFKFIVVIKIRLFGCGWLTAAAKVSVIIVFCLTKVFHMYDILK